MYNRSLRQAVPALAILLGSSIGEVVKPSEKQGIAASPFSFSFFKPVECAAFDEIAKYKNKQQRFPLTRLKSRGGNFFSGDLKADTITFEFDAFESPGYIKIFTSPTIEVVERGKSDGANYVVVEKTAAESRYASARHVKQLANSLYELEAKIKTPKQQAEFDAKFGEFKERLSLAENSLSSSHLTIKIQYEVQAEGSFKGGVWMDLDLVWDEYAIPISDFEQNLRLAREFFSHSPSPTLS
jgi:hypothetical protein